MVYDPTSGLMRDTVRLYIGDTDDSNLVFSDDEMDLFVTKSVNDEFAAAGLACYAIASSQARIAILVTTGNRDFTVDRKSAPDKLRLMGDAFFKQAENVPHCREVYLEDKDITMIDSWGGNTFDRDTRPGEFNNP